MGDALKGMKKEMKEIDFVPDMPDREAAERVRARWDSVAKPLDSLGKFETLTAQIGAILGTADINLQKKAVLILCGDNGIVEEGISQSGQEVTALVAASMGKGESSVCRMARSIGADVIPVDIGINCGEPIPGVLHRKVRQGTANFLREPAMTREEALRAIRTGMGLVADCKAKGYGILATGEMGIGNTTTSAAVAAALLGCPAERLVGRGAGLDNAGLERKREVVSRALEKYGFDSLASADLSDFSRALRVLSCVGGLDIAGMAGVFLGGAREHLPVVADGVISAVAALAAERLVPGVRQYILPSHKGREPASELILEELGLEPVLDAGLALGEGSGAVMLFGLLDMVMSVYRESATFEDIAVEQYRRF